MKCPMKFRLLQFEGGEECDPECAWRRGDGCAVNAEPLYVVKVRGVHKPDKMAEFTAHAAEALGDRDFIVVDDTVDVHAERRG